MFAIASRVVGSDLLSYRPHGSTPGSSHLTLSGEGLTAAVHAATSVDYEVKSWS